MLHKLTLGGLLFCALSGTTNAQGITFQEVTLQSGLDIPLLNAPPSLAVGDIDGDGWMDVMICGSATPEPQIFHNRGAQIAAGGGGPLFVNVTASLFPGGSDPASHALFADLDNDFDPDIVMVRRYPDPATGLPSPKFTGLEFYANQNGGRSFRHVPTGSTLARENAPFGGLSLGDPDEDGNLDVVYMHNGLTAGQGGSGYLIKNHGGFQFSDVTAAQHPALMNNTRYFSTILFDFNDDGFLDQHCAVDFYTDRHHHGGPGGTFSEVTNLVGTTNTGSDMGLAIGDPDMDGDFDLYSTNINIGVFYENDGNGNFQDTAQARGIYSFNHGLNTCAGWGTAFTDFDLDGDEDLIVIGSFGLAELFENDGTGHFSKVSSGAGIALIGRPLIVFDFDRDGDQDVLLSYEGVNRTPRLYENVTPSTKGRHWLTVHPQGTVSNTDAIGAKVEITVRGVKLVRAIVAGHSFRSGLPYYAHFGVGSATKIDEVKIYWPSGQVSSQTDVAVDQALRMIEPTP